jgi:aryl-alcohol dehydrogenase-like predicted oxidoreductase
MTFGEEWGWGASKEESRLIFDSFSEAGGNFIDTAVNYTDGTSEKYVGEFIASDRGHFVLATKYTMSTRPDDPNASGNHRKNMTAALERSLKTLKTYSIDLYWVHARAFMTPIEEVMRALDDMVRAGKVLYIGISNTPAWIISQANTLAALRGWSIFVGLQVRYSLIERSIERDLLSMARDFDMGVTAWGALGEGILTGKYNKEDTPKKGRASKQDLINERNLEIAMAVIKIAKEIGRLPSQVALNWLRQKEGVVIPIIGARTAAQITDNLACVEFELAESQLSLLDEASKIDLGYPYNFLGSDSIKDIIYSSARSKIDFHRS